MFLGITRTADFNFFAMNKNLTVRQMTKPKQGFNNFGTLCPYETADTENFTFTKGEVNTFERMFTNGCHIFYAQYFFARFISFFREKLRHFTTNHAFNNQVRGQFVRWPSAYIITITHNRYFVGYAEDFFHFMRDVNNGNPFCFEPVDNSK